MSERKEYICDDCSKVITKDCFVILDYNKAINLDKKVVQMPYGSGSGFEVFNTFTYAFASCALKSAGNFDFHFCGVNCVTKHVARKLATIDPVIEKGKKNGQ